MKPSNPLIEAWQLFLRTRAEGRVARIKAVSMCKFSTQDIELHHRASALHERGNKLDIHADVQFRKALKSVYGKRYRIEWKDEHTCKVWVHEPRCEDETSLEFNKSLRLSKRV